ncbi:MAG: MarR family transcriptional regulator [Bacteroidetes bacterium]|nr:MarR family transcriptional regulator [Bacteroidota bacterium]
MTKPGSPYCQCLYYASNALARMTTRMAEEEFSKVGLSPSYAFLIMTVAKKQGIQPGEISKALELTPSTITRLIEKMEKKGLLRRKFEGKTTEVYITAKGEALTDEIKKCWLSLYLRFSDILGEETSRQLSGMIYQAVKDLE